MESTVWPGRCCWHWGWQWTGRCVFVCLCLVWLEDCNCLWVLREFLNVHCLFIAHLSLLSVFTTHRKRKQKKKTRSHFIYFSSFTDLEVRALAQDVIADVQVVLRWRLGAFTLGLTLCSRHAQLTSLGERLQVVGRNCPEVKIRLISEQPEVYHNNWLAGSKARSKLSLSDVVRQILQTD